MEPKRYQWLDFEHRDDWYLQREEWFEVTFTEFFVKNHPGDFWHDRGRELFEERFGELHQRRESTFANQRNIFVSIGNDLIVGGDGDDIAVGDNLALVVPWATDGSMPAGSSRLSFYRRGLRADFGFILFDPRQEQLIDIAFSDTLNGGGDNDILLGQRGQDALDGGLGNDQMFGGADHAIIRSSGTDTTRWSGNRTTRSTVQLLQGPFCRLNDLHG